MPARKGRSKPPRSSASRRNQSRGPLRESAVPQSTVSFRWLTMTAGIAILAAIACAWATLCILFWQGSWQLLYHPTSAIERTPASVGLPFDSIGFASDAAGVAQLRGWWVPASTQRRYTAIYLHGADGNLGDTIDALIPLHNAGLNVFAFDYRGYGQSRFVHPSEQHWREDAESSIAYLVGTRHIPATSLILVGKNLGANLAVATAAAHPELAGVVLEEPLEFPSAVIFSDSRARLVPAHALVRDRWQLSASAANLRISSLWIYWTNASKNTDQEDKPEAYQQVTARKMLTWMTDSAGTSKTYADTLSRWLDDLESNSNSR
jgi:pimeloyl-ACP methyl ester carboxylesterase